MRDGGKGDRQRPLGIPEEAFADNWDSIFGSKCVFCNRRHLSNIECEEKTRFLAEGEARYQSDRAKRMGGDDGWRGD